jgi:hypothetical protein
MVDEYNILKWKKQIEWWKQKSKAK